MLEPDSGGYRLDHPVPIVLAAGGPKSLALAGRVDAGVDVLNLFLSNPATLRRDMTDFSQVIIRGL